MKMAKPFMTIQPRFTCGTSISLATVYTHTIYLFIISKLQGAFFCDAYSSRVYLDCNNENSHDLCGNAFVSNQMESNGSWDLAGIKDNKGSKTCG